MIIEQMMLTIELAETGLQYFSCQCRICVMYTLIIIILLLLSVSCTHLLLLSYYYYLCHVHTYYYSGAK